MQLPFQASSVRRRPEWIRPSLVPSQAFSPLLMSGGYGPDATIGLLNARYTERVKMKAIILDRKTSICSPSSPRKPHAHETQKISETYQRVTSSTIGNNSLALNARDRTL
ncbi:protein of unknown function [Hyphomicrobium sp. MC1]|nr:protein of unknown function [Hyphomicrobium sp. MC1]